VNSDTDCTGKSFETHLQTGSSSSGMNSLHLKILFKQFSNQKVTYSCMILRCTHIGPGIWKMDGWMDDWAAGAIFWI